MTPAAARRQYADCVTLGACHRERHRLVMSFRAEGPTFRKIYHYRDADLLELESRFGEEHLQRIYFHILALEALTLVSFRPRVLDPGPFARFWTPAFDRLWRSILRGAGAQWRYENDLPDYDGPVIAETANPPTAAPLAMPAGGREALAFCGGGKDSLIALKLLEKGGVPFAAYHYSHSCYGASDDQDRLIGRLLDLTGQTRRHSLAIEDSLHGVLAPQELLCAETPISVFGALPVVLQHGYRYIVVGHERSADWGNLVWELTGESINHQWGKSSTAESLIRGYLQQELIRGVTYCSVLQPVYDVVIFNMLRGHNGSISATHSCNIRKPWCGQCAKCCYIALNFMAYLPADTVARIFPRNLLDVPANLPIYRSLLGIAGHKPFECVGEVGEARLAMEICRRKGIPGRAVHMYRRERPANLAADLERYLTLAPSVMPPELARRVEPLLQHGAREAREYIARFI